MFLVSTWNMNFLVLSNNPPPVICHFSPMDYSMQNEKKRHGEEDIAAKKKRICVEKTLIDEFFEPITVQMFLSKYGQKMRNVIFE
ncbi:hypothetical protein B9Z55_010677 [Caenorhabditis nigoni]|uniref:Uncharacterized protein n=1 Tax=Caenorhabditis nigoni TaxID=1611254 RepID=A0A2G5UGV4_9PELO|nr:hypothetical protein B9Z55_010677 [Caenorhabditis nigoni]